MKLSEKLIKLRKERGLSQEDFGNAINVSRQAISKWEAEQTKPDIDKIKEIAKYFNVTFDYLLNDEIDEIIENNQENSNNSSKNLKKKKHVILKIFLIILLIYFLISLYKFILLYRYYKIANSFSEENYYMSYITKYNNETIFEYSTTKIGNIIINESTNSFAGNEALRNENGEIIPYDIEYVDQAKDIYYKLTYSDDSNLYIYSDDNRKIGVKTEDELNALMYKNKNIIKDFTLSIIPSNLKNILFYSIHPLCTVSLSKNEIYINNFNKVKLRIILSNDCLVRQYSMKTEFDGNIDMTFSYDYVPGHFINRSIENPIETYKDKIKNLDEIEL